MHQPNTNEPRRSTRIARRGCIIVTALTLAVSVLVVASFFFVMRGLSDFDSHRNKMCIRSGLVVEDENLRYSPGFDAAMWSRFTVRVNGISEVFDESKVDTSEFNQDAYDFRVDWIDDDWWNVHSRGFIGGEVEVGKNFMRVAYEDNGDGTLTVYVFWFEV